MKRRTFNEALRAFMANVKYRRRGCWEWQGHTKPTGYGEFHSKALAGCENSAHRISWLIHFGGIKKVSRSDFSFASTCVAHRCNNKKCVRPDHLYLTTVRGNLLDARKDGIGVAPFTLGGKRGAIKTPKVWMRTGGRPIKRVKRSIWSESTEFLDGEERWLEMNIGRRWAIWRESRERMAEVEGQHGR